MESLQRNEGIMSDEMQVTYIPIGELHADVEFNCRGEIAPIDVTDLARSMDSQGLQNPIMVQPYDFARKTTTGFTYRIVSGYRRHKAATILKWEKMPCIIRTGLTDAQARILNLGENLNRKDLNIFQEAKALLNLKIAGLSQEDVARELNKSRGWVQVRYMLLDLPEEVQQEAAAGLLNQQQIRDVYELRNDPKAQAEAVRTIKEARERGEKGVRPKVKPRSIHLKEHQSRTNIFMMIEHIQGVLGSNFATRCLAWAAGEISDRDLFVDIRTEAAVVGKRYDVPTQALSESSDVYSPWD